jgi:hypothetical protein
MSLKLRVLNEVPFVIRHLWPCGLQNPVVFPAWRKRIVELASFNSLFKFCRFALESEHPTGFPTQPDDDTARNHLPGLPMLMVGCILRQEFQYEGPVHWPSDPVRVLHG